MQKGFAGIIILIIALILAGLGGAYYFGKTQVTKPQVTQPIISPSSIPDVSPAPTGTGNSPVPDGTGETANWKTYNNLFMGISFRYPTDKNLQENPGKDNRSIIIGMPQSDYILGIFVFDNFDRLSILDWIKANFGLLYGNVEINNKKLAFQDLKMTGKQLIGQEAIEVEFGGQSPDIFFLNPNNLKVYKMMTNFNKDMFNQILSTFKFTP